MSIMKTLIKQVNVFDGIHSELQQGMNVVIQDNLVQEITSSQVSEESFDTVIQGEGRTGHARHGGCPRPPGGVFPGYQ